MAAIDYLNATARSHRVRGFALVLILFELVGCYQGPPYAFRLMLPPKWLTPTMALHAPFWLWEAVPGDFGSLKDCEDTRKRQAETAMMALKEMRAVPEQFKHERKAERMFERIVHSQCVPLR